jgi:hypothetical protein
LISSDESTREKITTSSSAPFHGVPPVPVSAPRVMAAGLVW